MSHLPSSDDQKQVAAIWSERLNKAAPDDFSPLVYWLAIPEVNKRFQLKQTLNPAYGTWYQYCVKEYLKDRAPVANMLSIGCGTGALERGLFKYCSAFQHCDAYDIAPGAIQVAREQAAAEGITAISYQVADSGTTPLPAGRYDAIWFNSSLHHIEPLEKMCQNVSQALAPGGYVFISEYVGPSRFAFSNHQKEVIRTVFNLIPERYRRSFRPAIAGKVQPAPEIPDPARVMAVDPSESIRSADIIRVVQETLNVVRINKAGGTILQTVLAGIAGNFRTEDPDSIRVLELLFQIEDTLTAVGDLQDDFALIIAQAKTP